MVPIGSLQGEEENGDLYFDVGARFGCLLMMEEQEEEEKVARKTLGSVVLENGEGKDEMGSLIINENGLHHLRTLKG